MSTSKWLRLKSDPDVMNKCLKSLGVPEEWGVTDIIDFGEDFISMIPSPCLAILLLFPITDNYQNAKDVLLRDEECDGIYFMKQTIVNSCGTIALIHALANNEHNLKLEPDSVIKQFLDSTRGLSPKERGQKLEENLDIKAAHEAGVQEGLSSASEAESPDGKKRRKKIKRSKQCNETGETSVTSSSDEYSTSFEDYSSDKDSSSDEDSNSFEDYSSDKDSSSDEDSNSFEDYSSDKDSSSDEDTSSDGNEELHYIALIQFGDKIVELDGLKSGPLVHSITSEETFVWEASRICKDYMEQEPGNINFHAMAFGAT